MTPTDTRRMPPLVFNSIVMCLAFTSGFIIMSVELLGGRILAPYFGSSIYVWGSIISIFMVSLSIGYLTGGRLSVNNPLLGRYGLLFVAAAVALIPGCSCDWKTLAMAPWLPQPCCFLCRRQYSA